MGAAISLMGVQSDVLRSSWPDPEISSVLVFIRRRRSCYTLAEFLGSCLASSGILESGFSSPLRMQIVWHLRHGSVLLVSMRRFHALQGPFAVNYSRIWWADAGLASYPDANVRRLNTSACSHSQPRHGLAAGWTIKTSSTTVVHALSLRGQPFR